MTPQEITRAREDLGLTQRALAEHLGVAANTVWRWEQDKSAPSPYYKQALEAMLTRPEDTFKAALQAKLLPTDNVTVETGTDRMDLVDEGPSIPMVTVRISRTYVMLIPVGPTAISDAERQQAMADYIARRFEDSFRAATKQTALCGAARARGRVCAAHAGHAGDHQFVLRSTRED